MCENFGHGPHRYESGSPEDRRTDAVPEASAKPAGGSYRDVIEEAPGAFFLVQDGRLLHLNPTVASIAGYSPEEIESKPFTDFIHPDDRERARTRHLRRLAGEAVSPRYSLRIIHKDGHPVWAELNSVKFDLAGKPATLNFLTDTTARREAVRLLLESEEKYRSLVESTEDSVYTMDPSLRYLYANTHYLDRHAVAAETLIGRRYGDFHSKEATSRLKQQLDGIFASGKAVTFETMDGHDKQYLIRTITPIKGADGKIVAVTSVSKDITERVRIENALRESEERFRTLVEQSPLGISLIGADGRYKYVNPRFREMFGYALEDVSTGSEWFRKAFPDPGLRRAAAAAWVEDRKQSGPGQIRPRVFEVCCKDGERKEIHFRPVTLENRDQFIIYEDISERRRLEDQLRQSQKMEAIGTLASGIAHEFNNVLAIILGNTELALMEMPEWNPVRTCLDQIQSASLRAKDLVKHILSFARKAPAARKPIQIALVVKDAMKLMRSTIPAEIDIRQNIACDAEIVSADPTEVHQIVMNLCTNAAHAMRRSEGVLTVELRPVPLDKEAAAAYDGLTPGDYVKLTIEDTGHGIAPEFMDRIFEPFFTTKEVGQGTGMGLAVVYGILKKYGGAIAVQSEIGQGTLVHVLLPRMPEPQAAEARAPEVLPKGSERILFVDDEASIVELASVMLQRQGYAVTASRSSGEALDLFRRRPHAFDLVISDLAMPQMAGDRLVQEMLKIRPEMPVILCSGYSDRVDEKDARAIGVKAFVFKPIMMKELAATVRKVLDAAKG